MSGEPKYKAIGLDLCKMISRGHYKSGDKLPSQQRLMIDYGVSLSTIRQTLKMMSDEGWVRPEHGKGVFVEDKVLAGDFAIVVKAKRLDEGVSVFHRLVCVELYKALNEHHPNSQVRLHTGKPGRGGESFADTLDLLENRIRVHLGGVFTLEKLETLNEQLFENGIPVVSLGGSGRYGAEFDTEVLFERGFEYLHKIGCRSIGVIGFRNPSTIGIDVVPAEKRITKILDRGVGDKRIGVNISDSVEEMGYQIANHLLDKLERPDALLVTDDDICSGVLRAILQRGIKLPSELKLISYTNRGVRLPYHLSVTRFEFDSKIMVQRAVEIMDMLLSGEKQKPINVRIKPDFILGDTA